MIRITFVIPSLSYGGAQMMLVKLLSRMDQGVFETEVISLTEELELAERFRTLGIPVRTLGMRQGIPDPRKILTLASWLRRSRPDLVQTWMYHADLLGGLATLLSGRPPVLWNIRHSDLNPAADKRMTAWTASVCAHLSSHLPQRIVCCAETARELHVALGYAPKKFVVIPNGFDLSAFRPDDEARARIRSELALPHNALVIGLAARFHPQKDHRGFMRAAGSFVRQFRSAYFVLCGDGVDPENRELQGWIMENNMADHVRLLGRRSDMAALTASFDVACSSSASGEAFSNTLGEAMACGVPCAATDVGDAAQIVGATGRIVPPLNPEALCAAWKELGDLGPDGRRALGARARQRVMEHFSLDRITARYEALYREVLAPAEAGERGAPWRAF